MIAPKNEYAFDYDVMKQAAKNWQQHESEREQKMQDLAEKRYDAVDSKERLAKRVNRLLDKVKQTHPRQSNGLSPEFHDLMDQEEVKPDDINNLLVERVIGETRDYLSMEFLEKALRVSRCVGRIVIGLNGGQKGYGTGFLVSSRLIMTNHHVLPTQEIAANSSMEFDYQLNRNGQPLTVQRFDLDPDTFFLNDQSLDFALVAVKPTSNQGKALTDYGWCPLIQDEGKISLGESINIIQHPNGEMKQIVIRENRLLDLLEIVAHYEADTDPGSSGSPVFNDQWEVIALHHSGVPRTDSKGRPLDINGNLWKQGDDPNRLDWVANEGIRISRLTNFIAAASIQAHEEELRAELLKGHDPLDNSPIGTFQSSQERTLTENLENSEEKETKTLSLKPEHTGSVKLTIPLQIFVSLG